MLIKVIDGVENQELEAFYQKEIQTSNRLNLILDMIGRLAALDFSIRLDQSPKSDTIDAITLGLNMLGEELQSNVVQKRELEILNQKLEKFAYATAHDLKTPLNTIMGLVAVLEMNTSKTSENQQYLTILKNTVDHMKNLIVGILDYSRKTSSQIEKEQINLKEILDYVVDTDKCSKSATIEIIGALPIVFYNRAQMIQIFRNLLSNAIKYGNQMSCKVIVKCIEKDSEYQISVVDNGIGIAKENHLKIFELHKRLDKDEREFDSHGIGLYTVKEIIESADGKIWVESSLGHGATFIFTINK